MTATAPCAVAGAARSVRSAERSSSRSTSRWTRARAGDPVPGRAADVFLLHHKHYLFQRPNARPLGRGAADSVRENARGTAPLRAAPSHTATLLPRRQNDGPPASDARDRTRCVFSHVPRTWRPQRRTAAGSPVGLPAAPRHDRGMKSRVHPTYKTRYRVGNWRAYERALVRRGDVTLWLSPDARAAWRAPPSGRPGGQQRFSDLAIETALMLRLVFHLPLRQTEGFVRSILTVMRAGLDAPDHTTLSRRSQSAGRRGAHHPGHGPLHLIVDSTGLSVVGEGEWAAAKHGGRGTRGWKKLHLGVDRSGVIVAHVLTEATVDDATVGIDLIGAAAGDIASVTADAAYDTVAFYEAASARTRGWSCRRPGRRRCRAADRARVRAIARSPTWKRSGGANGRRPRATTGRPAWRTPSSATSPSLAMAFALGVEVVGRSRRALRAAS